MASIEERRRILFAQVANQNRPPVLTVLWGLIIALLNFASWVGGLLYLTHTFLS